MPLRIPRHLPRREWLAVTAAVAIAIAFGAFGIVRGTFAVGGSDSACYALMADAFARGQIQPSSALAREAPWPDAPLTSAPAGFIPSRVRPDASSPICAPGFALFMAPLRWVADGRGIFLVTPVAGVALILATFAVARFVGGPSAGGAAALIVAASPVALFQVVQPMNDIATAAGWMSVVAFATIRHRSRWLLMGVATSIALLIRPNLAPCAVVVTLWIAWQQRPAARPVLQYIGAAAPGVMITLALNTFLYGHPLRFGYGDAGALFSAANVGANAANFGRALIETQTPLPLFAPLALYLTPRERRPIVWLALGVAAATVAVYLLYTPFPEWWYLRFLLPALAICLALVSSMLVHTGLGLPGRLAVPAATVAAVLVAAFGLRVAENRQVFALHRLEARFHQTADAVATRLPPNAAFITVWHSGTLRFHPGREIVMWDALDQAWLDPAVAWLEQRGFEPFIVVERWEEPLFRARFAATRYGGLDWPPQLEIARQVRVFSPRDRERYLAGGEVRTDHVGGR